MARKLLSFLNSTSCLTVIEDPLDSMVLPLLKSSNIAILTLDEASHILEVAIRDYFSKCLLTATPSDQVILRSNRDACIEYFDQLSKDELYDLDQSRDIYPVLIKIAEKLQLNHSASTNVSDILDPLIYSILNRTCIDQHRSSLKSILTADIVQQFDPPLQPFIQLIYERMESQIALTLKDWSHTVFQGCVDIEPVHSEHIVRLFLDDIYGTAGGSLSSESDLIFTRTDIGRIICEAVFKDKLTLKHFFSNGSENWKESLAKQLSIGEAMPPSDFKLSTENLLQCPKFLNYLKATGALTDCDLTFLEATVDSSIEESIIFDFSWLSFSDAEIGNEFTLYNETFVNLLIHFIHETLFSEPSNTVDRSSYSENHGIDFSIQDKLLHEYFLCTRPKTPFTYEQIKHAFDQPCSSDYSKSFFIPYLRLSAFMLQNCDPQDAPRLFYEYISPNFDQSWAFDVLLHMSKWNLDSLKMIPFKDLLNLRSRDNKPFFDILIEDHPSTFQNFIYKGLIPLELFIHLCTHVSDSHSLSWFIKEMMTIISPLLSSTPRVDGCIVGHQILPARNNGVLHPRVDGCIVGHQIQEGSTFLHLIAEMRPAFLIVLFDLNIVSIKDLIQCKNSHQVSVFDFLCSRYPLASYECLASKPDILFFLEGNKSFELLVDLSSDSEQFIQLIKSGSLPQDYLQKVSCKESYLSFIEWLAYNRSELFFTLLSQELLSLDFLCSIKNDFGNTIFHNLIHESASLFLDFLINNPVIGTEICFLTGHGNVTILHSFARYNGSFFKELVTKLNISFPSLSQCSLKNSLVTPLHLLAQYQPDVLLSFIRLDPILVASLSDVLDSKKRSPLDWLVIHQS